MMLCRGGFNSLADDHLRADLHPVIEIDHFLIQHADAAGRYGKADRPGLPRAMDAEKGVLIALIEVHGPRTQRVVGASGHAVGILSCQGIALDHFLGRMPVGPFGLSANLGYSAPCKPKPADTDA